MSTTSTAVSHSTPFFTQLVQRLRVTNARYGQLAHQRRRMQRPTDLSKAKQRARGAGLSIDTAKACACPRLEEHSRATAHRHISKFFDDPTTSATSAGTTEGVEEGCQPGSDVQTATQAVDVRTRPATSLPVLLGLGLRSVDGLHACDLRTPFRVAVSGAPWWWSKWLPEESEGKIGVTMKKESGASCTYEVSCAVYTSRMLEWGRC